MDNTVNEIAYNILQNEYLKRKNISTSEDNIKNIILAFPEDWFLKYSIEKRIKIISFALKNNLEIQEIIDSKNYNK